MSNLAVEYSNGEVNLISDESLQDVGNGDNSRKSGPGPNSKEIEKKKGVKVFLENVKADILNKDLLPLKILFFFKYATLFVLYPFLILQLKSLGFDEAEAGIINAFIPIIGILGPPLSGVVADKIGNFKVLLAIITLLNAPLSMILLLVPKARETVILPDTMMFSLSCGSNGMTSLSNPYLYNTSFILSSIDSSICTITPNSKQWNDQSNVLLQCGHVCPYGQGEDEDVQFLKKNNAQLIVNSLGGRILIKSSSNAVYLLPNQKSIFVPLSYSMQNTTQDHLLMNQLQLPCKDDNDDANTNCSSESFSYNTLSTTDKLRLGLFTLNYSQLRFIGGGDDQKSASSAPSAYNLKNPPAEHLKLQLNVSHPSFQFQGPFKLGDVDFSDYTSQPECSSDSLWKERQSTNYDAFSRCTPQCLFEMNRTLFCSNTQELRSNDVLFSFLMYTVVRVLLGVVSATGFIMFEGAVLIILKEFGGDYGLQRVSATLAAVVASPIAGILLQVFDDFRPAFYLYGILQIISTVLTIKINLEFRKPGDKILSHLKEVLSQIEILIFFIAMLLSGTIWGYLESFLFWFLESLGGSRILMGLTISVGGLAGIPLLICSRPIIKKFGHVNVLCVGLLFFFFRLVGYSYIQNPWTCLVFESMEAFTASLAITAAATYSASLSTEQTIATVQGLWGSLYFGIGRGVGSAAGGFLQKEYGARHTFRIFALVALVGAILYFLVNILYLRRLSKHKKVQGTDFGDIKGNKQIREEIEKNSISGSNANLEPVLDAKLDGVYNGISDVNKFTDVPLDEDQTPTRNRKLDNSNGKGFKNRVFGKQNPV